MMSMVRAASSTWRASACASSCRTGQPQLALQDRNYGGESFPTEPLISGAFRARREYAAMIARCRAQGPGKVSLGGISSAR
jgi:hypothetical protein